jgi:ABC-type sugar transport system ATPase subunit
MIRTVDLRNLRLSKAGYQERLPRATLDINQAMASVEPILARVKNGTVSEVEINAPKIENKCSFERIYFSRGNDKEIYDERKNLGRYVVPNVLKTIDFDLDNTVFSFIPNTAESSFYGMIKGLEDHLNDRKFDALVQLGANADPEKIIQAAKIANAHNFIERKEQGYATLVGDRGSKLSGGEKQRVTIARAVLKNPPILILDEATSSIDTYSEELIQKAAERITLGRTSSIIAHRLATIMNANKIIVIHKGQIVEEGTHQELVNKVAGYYKNLYDSQFVLES